MEINLVFLGPPGSGKGTQALMVAGKYNLIHLATGDIFRDEIQRGTLFGERVKEYLSRGELVPDHLVIEALKMRLESSLTSEKCGFVADGFPRTINQAVCFDELLSQLKLKLLAVFFIDVNDDEIIRRLSGRRVCPNCRSIYHMVYTPPKMNEMCDLCGEKLIQREDDSPEVIKRRLQVYYEQTEPVISYYEKNRILHTINGIGSVEDVHMRIEGILKLELGREDFTNEAQIS